MSGAGWNGNLFPESYAPTQNKKGRDHEHETWFNRTSPGFFQTMHTTILVGRDFAKTDAIGSPEVMILGEKTAHDLFGNESPIGKYLNADSGPGGTKRFQIIGVVADTKYREVKEQARRTAFMPLAQDNSPWPRMTMMVRSESPLASVIPGLRDVIVRAHPELSLQFAVLDLQIRETLRTQRVVAILSTFFSCIAVMLALIGLYGVTSYAVTQRRGEIGIRMALGAQRSSVVWLILREVAFVLVAGSILGIAMSLGTGKLLTTLMYGMQPADPVVLLSAAGILTIAGALAGLFPAMRASRIDPAMALRYE
jgi:predicted permease